MDTQKTLIGTIISLDIPQVASLLPQAGYDFIFIDLEHGVVSDATIATIVLTKQKGCLVLARIRAVTERDIKHVLDLGCDGIIAPRVESMAEIQTLVDYSFYPPNGKRSVGFGLANKFGLDFKSYTDNFKPLILPQVESFKGLELVDQIAANPRVSGIFVGPYDLSMSLGVPGDFSADKYISAIHVIRKGCRAYGKCYCTFTSSIQAASDEISKGTGMVAIGVDANLLLNQYTQIIKTLKNA